MGSLETSRYKHTEANETLGALFKEPWKAYRVITTVPNGCFRVTKYPHCTQNAGERRGHSAPRAACTLRFRTPAITRPALRCSRVLAGGTERAVVVSSFRERTDRRASRLN